jgi:hypothetical protein
MSKRSRRCDLLLASLAVIWALLGVAVGEPSSKPVQINSMPIRAWYPEPN